MDRREYRKQHKLIIDRIKQVKEKHSGPILKQSLNLLHYGLLRLKEEGATTSHART